MTLAQQIWDQLSTWAEQFELELAAVGPDGEVAGNAVRMGDVAGADIHITREGPQVDRVFVVGELFASNRRLVVTDAKGQSVNWIWSDDVDRAGPLPDGAGVALTPAPARYDEGRRMTAVMPAPVATGDAPSHYDPSPLYFAWLMVVGTWRASRGELDQWRAWVADFLKLSPR